MAETFNPTPDQLGALDHVMDWYKGQGRSGAASFLTLGGYAGTGKTTLIARFRALLAEENPETSVSFCAFTGKASQVLNAKLREQGTLGKGDSVSTIHGLIYEAIVDDEGRLLEWRKRKKVKSGLIILDEASMVGSAIWSDLLSFGVPILAVGDHGQLPPINDSFSLMKSPEVRLEQIHRQAQDSPIIRVSQLVRETGKIPFGSFGSGVAKIRSQELDLEDLLGAWNSDTLFLAGKNVTRVALNKKIRALRGYESPDPCQGDRVICLRNNWERHIFNGQLGHIVSLSPGPLAEDKKHWYQAEIAFDDEALFRGLVSRHQFNAPKTLMEVPGLRRSEMGDLFDFGYALTVHKAQGSQARRAVVFEERMMREEDLWRRWLYTAVTRAEEELLVVAQDRGMQE